MTKYKKDNILIPLPYFSTIDICAKGILFLEAYSNASSSETLFVFSFNFTYKSYLLLTKTITTFLSFVSSFTTLNNVFALSNDALSDES